MNTPAAPLNGLVLAGGRSRRFGRDKAGVEIAGQTLLERTVQLLAAHCENVWVSVRRDQTGDALRSRFPLLIDPPGQSGPPAALLAARAAAAGHAWLIVACDLPGLDAAAFACLLEARDTARVATALRSPSDGLPEPLCAIYEPSGLELYEELSADGPLSPRVFLVEQAAKRVAPPRPEALSNMNRPEDLARLQAKESRP
jgi:molybdopterin-guanine dinucleotide biosynthesis protein A